MTDAHSESEPNVVTLAAASAIRQTPVAEIREPVRGIVHEAIDRAERSLAQPFDGVTIGERAHDDLFPLAATGVSVEPIVGAAERFLAALSIADRETATFAVGDDVTWRSWHNTHFYLMRHGLLMADMDPDTKDLAFELLRTTMSEAGFENARDIMRLNGYVAEITQRPDEYDEFFYWISVFGTPSRTEPWGWQIDGHHLIVNCLIVGDQLVMTPDFRGSEPVRATSGTYAGTVVFQEEESTGLDLFQSLTDEQRAQATIGEAPPRLLLTTAQFDNVELDDVGLSVSEMTPAQRDLFIELISLYTDRVRPGHAEVRFDEVMGHLEHTKFSWMGSDEDGAAFYYRIASPVILIEFDHLPGIVYDNTEPSRRHVHTIVRTPNGNDYGRSLLREHYRQHDHADPTSPHRQGRH